MISEEDVERAVGWLSKNAAKIGEARAHMVELEEARKMTKASLMRKASPDVKTASDREAYAYAHEDYKTVAMGYAAACGEFERLRVLVGAAHAKIELWRSLEATKRHSL